MSRLRLEISNVVTSGFGKETGTFGRGGADLYAVFACGGAEGRTETNNDVLENERSVFAKTIVLDDVTLNIDYGFPEFKIKVMDANFVSDSIMGTATETFHDPIGFKSINTKSTVNDEGAEMRGLITFDYAFFKQSMETSVERTFKGDFKFARPTTQNEVGDLISSLKKTYAKSDIYLCSGGRRNTASEERVNAEGGVVVDLAELDSVSVQGQSVTVGPGATMRDLADVLMSNKAFLPIFQDETTNVVASLRHHDWVSMWGRAYGSMRNFVEAIVVVDEDGKTHRYTKEQLDARGWATFTVESQDTVIEMTFKCLPQSAQPVFKYLQVPYHHDAYVEIINQMNSMASDTKYAKLDIEVRVKRSARHTHVIHVQLAGASDLVEAKEKEIVASIFGGKEEFTASLAESMLETFFAMATALRYDFAGNHHWWHYNYPVIKVDSDTFKDYCKLSDEFMGQSSTYSSTAASTRLQIRPDGKTHFHVYVYAPVTHNLAELAFRKRMVTELTQTLKGATHKVETVTEALTRRTGWEYVLSGCQAPRIPGFLGDIFIEGDKLYDKKRKQYATSSYELIQGEQDRTHPHMVTYPSTIEDIQAAIKYAGETNKSIVARSGGHQYCCLSSGSDTTIVLSMEAFVLADYSHDKRSATLGVGNKLYNAADLNLKHDCTIPHGECPYVGTGGHTQTGGYGHILRSYGLLVDHVRGFEIVLADGRVLDVEKPQGRPDLVNSENDMLYWSVLGGCPGGFGVITHFTYDMIRDKDHGDSYGIYINLPYTKEAMKAIMDVTQSWTQRSQPGAKNPLPADIDFMATCMHTPSLSPGHWYSDTLDNGISYVSPAILFVEFVYGNAKGTNNDPNKDTSIKEITDAYKKILDASKTSESIVASIAARFSPKFNGPMKLSELSNAFVRRDLIPISEGREFPNPYEKSVHLTYRPLSDAFVDAYVNHVHDVVHNKDGLQMVHQQCIGGGVPTIDRTSTSMCLREVSVSIVFDVFHPPNPQGRTKALACQDIMTSLLPEYQGDKSPDTRCLWGSFGDTHIEKCWDNYYVKHGPNGTEPDVDKYKQLIAIKNNVDPTNVFRTQFTIPLEYAEPPNEWPGTTERRTKRARKN